MTREGAMTCATLSLGEGSRRGRSCSPDRSEVSHGIERSRHTLEHGG